MNTEQTPTGRHRERGIRKGARMTRAKLLADVEREQVADALNVLATVPGVSAMTVSEAIGGSVWKVTISRALYTPADLDTEPTAADVTILYWWDAQEDTADADRSPSPNPVMSREPFETPQAALADVRNRLDRSADEEGA